MLRKPVGGQPLDPKWGAFIPTHRINGDQVFARHSVRRICCGLTVWLQIPLPFINAPHVTWTHKGDRRVHVRQPGGGALEKRQCTLWPHIVMDGEQFIKPVLIFRGKGMRISAVEKAAWNPGVYHVFQENAWADRAVCEEVMKHVVVEAVRKKAAETGDDSWWLYLCDNLDGHKCDGFKNASATGKVQVHYHAVDTTDMSQVRGRVQCRAVRSLVCVSVCITAMEAGWRVYQSVLCRRWTAAAAGA